MFEIDHFWVNLVLTCSCREKNRNHMEDFMPALVSVNYFILPENAVNYKVSETIRSGNSAIYQHVLHTH